MYRTTKIKPHDRTSDKESLLTRTEYAPWKTIAAEVALGVGALAAAHLVQTDVQPRAVTENTVVLPQTAPSLEAEPSPPAAAVTELPRASRSHARAAISPSSLDSPASHQYWFGDRYWYDHLKSDNGKVPAEALVNLKLTYVIAKQQGQTDVAIGCVDNLWSKEAQFRTKAANPSGAYGIPEALPGSKMAEMGSDWRTNPVTQILWGFKYIRYTYGPLCAAWQHSVAQNWYRPIARALLRRR